MNIIVSQFYTPNVSYGQYAENINRKYCEANGYTYFVEKDKNKIMSKIPGRSFTWYKPHLIQEVLDTYPDCDYVLFIDIDAIFCNNVRKIEEFISNDFSVLMTHDYGPSLVNAGVILLKNDNYTKTFLKEWWDICEEYPQYKEGLWHDQTCIGLWHQRQSDSSKFKIIDYSDFNSREYDEKRFIFHAFSYGMLPNRTIDLIHNNKFNIEISKNVKNLDELGKYYSTDKQYIHNYFNRFYQTLLTPYQHNCDILEIGILNGESLKIWRHFFDSGFVHGADVKYLDLKDDRTETFLIDQSSEESLRNFKSKGFVYDVIIDDGSHKMLDQQITIQVLFDSLKSGGHFVIEDLQTSLECRMPAKYIFNWGDPTKSTCLEMLESIRDNSAIIQVLYRSISSLDSNTDSLANAPAIFRH